jgi:hypothetical protein
MWPRDWQNSLQDSVELIFQTFATRQPSSLFEKAKLMSKIKILKMLLRGLLLVTRRRDSRTLRPRGGWRTTRLDMQFVGGSSRVEILW